MHGEALQEPKLRVSQTEVSVLSGRRVERMFHTAITLRCRGRSEWEALDMVPHPEREQERATMV
jgi:hypothetical protein